MNSALVLSLIACFSVSLKAELRPIKDEPWEFLMLAQFWTGSSCVYFRKAGCLVPPGPDRWTIHGLWPSNHSSQQPEFCNKTMKFNFTEIEDLQAQLNESWPNYNSSGHLTDLWAHEWEKHGTCAYSLPALQGELKYFNTTLQLYSHLDVYQVLKLANIIPSKDIQYDLNDIFSAVVKAYGMIPQIECSKAEGKHYLDQVWLCYDKSLNLMNCSAAHSSNFRRPRSNSVQKSMQFLLFESENFVQDGHAGSLDQDAGGHAGSLGTYFVDCPKDNLVYYIPIPRVQTETEIRVEVSEHIIES